MTIKTKVASPEYFNLKIPLFLENDNTHYVLQGHVDQFTYYRQWLPFPFGIFILLPLVIFTASESPSNLFELTNTLYHKFVFKSFVLGDCLQLVHILAKSLLYVVGVGFGPTLPDKKKSPTATAGPLHVFFRLKPIRFEVHIQPLQRLLTTVHTGTQWRIIASQHSFSCRVPLDSL